MIVLRRDKTSPLTREELDNNFLEIDLKVGKTGNETITGVKTFTESPIVPTLTLGDVSDKIATAKFVGNAITASQEVLTTAISNIPMSDNTKLPLTGGTLSGNLTINANLIVTGNITETSDKRIKSDISPLIGALDKVLNLQGVSYLKNGSTDKNIGFIAQDVIDIVPEVVKEIDGLYSVAYGNIVALLVEAIKEQETRIKELESKV
jgi:hypothetical protein